MSVLKSGCVIKVSLFETKLKSRVFWKWSVFQCKYFALTTIAVIARGLVKTLNDWSRGKQSNKINCFPRDQSLCDLWIAGNFEARNSLNLVLTAVVGQRTLLPSGVIDFATLPAQRFWRETVSLLDVMWPRSNQWECALLGKISSYITNKNDSGIPFLTCITLHNIPAT